MTENNGFTPANDSKNRSRFEPKHAWEIPLKKGIVTFNPANKLVDSVVNPVSIGNMLANATFKKNSAGNFTVYYAYKSGAVKVTGFLGTPPDVEITDEDLTKIDPATIVHAMTSEEMEAEWSM